MSNTIEQLDEIEKQVMGELKDFQAATVKRVTALFGEGKLRVLVSDEVGLGKTLVARGVIAWMAKQRGSEGLRVAYVCNNASIAEQNLRRLQISPEVRTEKAGTSRLSMQHYSIAKQERNAGQNNTLIRLIPLTPATSFRLTAGNGICDERALMFAFLRRIEALKDDLDALDVAMKDYATANWDRDKESYEAGVQSCDAALGNQYIARMVRRVEQEVIKPCEDGSTCLKKLKALCEDVRQAGYKLVQGNGAIGKLRSIFAQISLDALRPDLVIMDEFQRYKYLIDEDDKTEMGMLTRKFFNSENVKILLLSATPYKLFSTLEEVEGSPEDEAYSEFLKVLEFLNADPQEQERFKQI